LAGEEVGKDLLLPGVRAIETEFVEAAMKYSAGFRGE
jgi:hypothetical protein